MSFTKTRYVAACQQLLVAGTVAMLGVTATGALTLDIVSPDAGNVPAAPATTPRTGSTGSTPVIGTPVVSAPPVRAQVAEKAVAPKVRQVKLATPDTSVKAEPKVEVRTDPKADPKADPARTTTPRRDARAATPETIAGLPVVLTSPAEAVQGFATVGAVWNHGVDLAEDSVAFQVRTEKEGTWSQWQRLEYHDDHGPDGAEAASGNDRPGTEPSVVGNVDRVQLRVASAAGVPAGLEFSLIDPGTTKLAEGDAAIDTSRIPATDASTRGKPIESTAGMPEQDSDGTLATDGGSSTSVTTDAGATDDIALSAMTVAPKPQIFSRAQWGADEKLREKGLPDYGTIKTGFVHHTVNANDYTKAQVPAIIRSIYAYHVLSRGWRDIGYNFLVDRFGRIWEGRYGGVDKPVTGAHTLGFNDVAFAMSAIGNYDIAKPPQAIIDAYAKLFAWKLSKYNISATASGLKIHGKTLHAINGHRDVGQTACPGKYLYARIPDIRAEAARIQAAAQAYNPNQTPTAATKQPKKIRPGGVRSLLGRSGADVAMITGDNHLAVLPVGRLVRFHGGVKSAGSWAGAIPVGDVTGDGRGDVLTPRAKAKGWLLHHGKKGGKVAKKATGRALFRPVVTLVPVGDWDGDHRADVLGITRKHALVLYRGRGKGTFAAGKVLARHWTYKRTVAGGDLDHNGRPELLVQSKAGHRYRIPSLSTTRLGKRLSVAIPRSYRAYYGAGDMTGDGLADVWVRARNGAAFILPGNGHGGFGSRLGPFSGFGKLRLRGVVNMAGGARADVVGVNRKGALVVRANNQQTNVGRVIVARQVGRTPSQVLTVGDWNHDGKGDVIVRTDAGSRMYLFKGKGTGGFAKATSMSGDWSRVTRLAAVGDITGDGYPDLVGRNSAGTLVVYPGNGVSGFHRPQSLPKKARTTNLVGGASWATNHSRRPWRSPPTAVSCRWAGPTGCTPSLARAEAAWASTTG